MSVTIESGLKEILEKLDRRFDYLTSEVSGIRTDVTAISVEMATVKTKLDDIKGNIKEVKGSQKAQIWTLICILGSALLGTVTRFIIS